MKKKEVKKTTITAESQDSFVIRMKGHLPICLDAKQFQSLKDAFRDWINWEGYVGPSVCVNLERVKHL